MTNIFIDCGFYTGNTLRRYIANGTVDETWEVYAFEPNTELDIKTALETMPFKIHLIKKAAWIKGGKIKFHISGREDSASIQGTTGHTDPDEVVTPSINFSKFVANLPDDAYIICSMDMEGAEFKVLEKMLKENTIDKIRILDVEFHHRFMQKETHHDAEDLISRIKARGVGVILKVATK